MRVSAARPMRLWRCILFFDVDIVHIIFSSDANNDNFLPAKASNVPLHPQPASASGSGNSENVWVTLTLLGTDNHPLYRPEWGWVRFPDGLHSAARMAQYNGAGLIGYRITEVEPPRRLWFGEIPGLDGSHGYVLEPVDGGTRISHMLSAESSIIPYLVWTVALRHSHDAISERILDNLELLVTGTIAIRTVPDWVCES